MHAFHCIALHWKGSGKSRTAGTKPAALLAIRPSFQKRDSFCCLFLMTEANDWTHPPTYWMHSFVELNTLWTSKQQQQQQRTWNKFDSNHVKRADTKSVRFFSFYIFYKWLICVDGCCVIIRMHTIHHEKHHQRASKFHFCCGRFGYDPVERLPYRSICPENGLCNMTI